jgi:hypothetical protein
MKDLLIHSASLDIDPIVPNEQAGSIKENEELACTKETFMIHDTMEISKSNCSRQNPALNNTRVNIELSTLDEALSTNPQGNSGTIPRTIKDLQTLFYQEIGTLRLRLRHLYYIPN